MLGTKIPELMDFPAQVSFKVVGKNEEQIRAGIDKVMADNQVTDFTVESRQSSKGNYVSCSVTLNVKDPAHMEKLYTELSQVESVLMVI